MVEERKLLGEYLLENGKITQAQLKEAIDESKRTHLKIGEVLIRLKYATEEDVAEALSKQLGFIFVDLSSYRIDEKILSLIPTNVVLKLQAMPILKVGSSLTVAMIDPLDVSIIDELNRITGGLRITPVLSTPTGIKKAIEKYYKQSAEITPPQAEPKGPARPEAKEADQALLKEAEQASVIRLVDKILEQAVEKEASDIHIEPQEKAFFIRFRIDGILQDIDAPDKKLQRAVVSRIKIMADIDIAQNRLPQDGRIQTKISGRDVDLRIATFPTIYGEHVSIRILDKSQGIVDLKELGFQADDLKKVKDIISKPYGFILITGPTGSGKTSTLYTILNTINDLKKNIITIEDPVEYTIERIHQTQVNVKAGLTFAVGLRSVVRLDPDIIMIGEIRDKETADIAIQSSLTGHLVFSTLHTNDAPSSAIRLIDIGIEPFLITSSLIGIVAQRLVRKLCPKCKKEYKPGAEELSAFVNTVKKAHKPIGCESCNNTGYKGRVGIFEVLIPNNEIKELINKKVPPHELKKAAQKFGMKTLQEDGLKKVEQGITSLSEVLRVTKEV